jgi:hypothetical protein
MDEEHEFFDGVVGPSTAVQSRSTRASGQLSTTVVTS